MSDQTSESILKRSARRYVFIVLICSIVGLGIVGVAMQIGGKNQKRPTLQEAIARHDFSHLDLLLQEYRLQQSSTANALPPDLIPQVLEASPEVLEHLLAKHVLAVDAAYGPYTLLSQAILQNRPAHVKMLLDAGSPLTDLENVLVLAIQRGNRDSVTMVVTSVKPELIADKYSDLLVQEAFRSDPPLTLLLFSRGIGPKDVYYEGAAEKFYKTGQLELLKELLLLPAFDPLYQTRFWKNSMLHVLTYLGATDFIPMLLALGADVNQKNKMADSAILIAIRSGDADLFCALAKANDLAIEYEEFRGENARDLAANNKNERMVDLVQAELDERHTNVHLPIW